MSGKGRVKVASGAFGEFPVAWSSRADRSHGGTSPEELIAAAHAACYSMAFSNGLAKAGHHPERLNTTAEVEFVPGTGITTITLTVKGHIHGLAETEFHKLAEEAKNGCPVSQALKGNVKINLKAELDHTH
jgi:osmotically inducible protein OsmC